MSETVIRNITPSVVTFSAPFKRWGIIPIGARSVAIKLKSGDVWVLASTPFCPETKSKLNQMGTVKWLIAANAVHHLYVGDFKKEYPRAKLIGVRPLLNKRQDLPWDGAYGHDPKDTEYGFESEIKACYFTSHPSKDVAFLHPDSKSMINADLLFNLPAIEQFSKAKAVPWFLRSSGYGPWSMTHKRISWYLLSTNRDVMRREAREVANWDFDRVIPCHGDILEKDGNAAWKAAFQWYLE